MGISHSVPLKQLRGLGFIMLEAVCVYYSFAPRWDEREHDLIIYQPP